GLTASAHIITAVIGLGVLALAWEIAQLGWIAEPIVLFLFSFVTYYCSCLLASCYRTGDPGKRNYTYMEAVKSNLVLGFFQFESNKDANSMDMVNDDKLNDVEIERSQTGGNSASSWMSNDGDRDEKERHEEAECMSNKSVNGGNNDDELMKSNVSEPLDTDKVNNNEVPTCVNEKGDEVVIFDEELVKEGSEKWKYTVCGYFVGSNMPGYEVKYNIRRMGGMHGLDEIVVDNDDLCFAKFKKEGGMNYVVYQSPWMVNGRPFIVQKWDLVKSTPCKILVWIRLFNVPLEAWSIKGISTISSRPRTAEEKEKVKGASNKVGVKDGYTEVRNGGYTNGIGGNVNKRQGGYQGRNGATNNNGRTDGVWNIGRTNVEELKKSANKYAVLSEENPSNNEDDIMIDKRLIVD
ncbi:RNA-directed DNA polymerase, eukaryota, reverse transcriptase zinc-binding domain protein, partial [Tanacetum coccineum]